MAILYHENFDSDSTGALVGWANGTGATFVVATSQHPVSGTKSFGEASFTGSHTAVYTGIAAQADQSVQISQVVQLDGSNAGANMGVSLRTDAAATTSGYYFVFDLAPTTPQTVYIFKRVSGSFTLINSASPGTFANGDVMFLKAECSGTTIRVKVWNRTALEPAAWTLSITDASVSAAGYAGLYTGSNGAGHGSTVSFCDDLFIGDVGTAFSATIAVNDANIFYSPYNWLINSSTYAQTVNSGAYIKTGFNGTGAILNIDVTGLSGASVPAGQYPRVRWSIDGGAYTTQQLVSGQTGIVLAVGLTSTLHQLVFKVLSIDNNADRWTTPVNSVKATGLVLDYGSGTGAVSSLASKRLIAFGDSISEGAWVLMNSTPTTNYTIGTDASAAWIEGFSQAFAAECGNVSFPGVGFITANAGSTNPSLANSWNLYFSGHSRLSGGLFSPAPDYLVLNHGENDGSPAASDVTSQLTAFRTAAGAACFMFVVIPFGQRNASTITTGFNNYQSATPDTKCRLINIGIVPGVNSGFVGPTLGSFDGVHPDIPTQGRLGAMVSQAVVASGLPLANTVKSGTSFGPDANGATVGTGPSGAMNIRRGIFIP